MITVEEANKVLQDNLAEWQRLTEVSNRLDLEMLSDEFGVDEEFTKRVGKEYDETFLKLDALIPNVSQIHLYTADPEVTTHWLLNISGGCCAPFVDQYVTDRERNKGWFFSQLSKS